jgi:hypothetical protein
MSHPLLQVLLEAAHGRFPPADGSVTYLPPFAGGAEAVVALTGHSFIASRLGPADLADLAPDGFGGSLAPKVLSRLADGGDIGVIDVTLAANGKPGPSALSATERWDDHPRVRYARSIRSDVQVFGDDRGFVTVSHGLAGRQEMSVELVAHLHNSGTGRSFVAAARQLVEPDTWLFAAVSPGNARSLRAFLAEGFTPIGSEVLIGPRRVGAR